MKISTILVFVLVFTMAVGGAATFFNDVARNHGVILQENVSSSYDRIQDYYDNLESVEGQIQGSDSAATDTTDANFITSVKSMWSSVQLFFNSLGFATDLSGQVGEDLGVPNQVITVIMALILLSFLALIFSIAVRWKSD
jgi:hypothetical protein